MSLHNVVAVVADHATVVAADADTVYELVADAAARPEWMGELVAVDAPPGPVGEGQCFTGYTSLLFHDFVGRSEVTTCVPGARLTEQVVIGARFTSDWSFEPAGPGRTMLRHRIVIDYPGGPFSRLERWVLRRRMATMQRRSLGQLARRLGGGEVRSS